MLRFRTRQAGCGDELAACLGRFLTATADETTMARARHALLLWQATTAAG